MKYSGLSESSLPNVRWEGSLLGLSERYKWPLLHQHSCDNSQMTEACTMEKPPRFTVFDWVTLGGGVILHYKSRPGMKREMTPTATGNLAQWKPRFYSYSCFDAGVVGLWGLGERSHGGTGTISLEHYLVAPITVGNWSYHGHCMGPCPQIPKK